IKKKGNIVKIKNWKEKSVEEIVSLISECGVPAYNNEDISSLFGGEMSDEKIKNRFMIFAEQIKENADKFDYDKYLIKKSA
ncbi:hypothetical protein ACFLTE_12565, partial [Bacteroidota bacterium]